MACRNSNCRVKVEDSFEIQDVSIRKGSNGKVRVPPLVPSVLFHSKYLYENLLISMSGEHSNSVQDSSLDSSVPDGNSEMTSSMNSDSEDPSKEIASESNPASEAEVSSEKAPADNESRLLQLEKEHETLKSQYMRIAADFDNFRKRQSRDQDDLRLQLICSTLSEILPIVDNFERARQQLDPQGEEAQSLHRSYQGLYKQLVDVLKQLGVAPMRVIGQAFDPSLHEAVMREPSDEHPEDIVVEELQRGYHLNGKVLRHALVKVSMGPGPNLEAASAKDLEVASEDPVENPETPSAEEI